MAQTEIDNIIHNFFDKENQFQRVLTGFISIIFMKILFLIKMEGRGLDGKEPIF